MAFNQGPDRYFKDLFLKNYRTPEEAQEQASNTDEFAMWLIANPEQASERQQQYLHRLHLTRFHG